MIVKESAKDWEREWEKNQLPKKKTTREKNLMFSLVDSKWKKKYEYIRTQVSESEIIVNYLIA